jgi:hypothetical protein
MDLSRRFFGGSQHESGEPNEAGNTLEALRRESNACEVHPLPRWPERHTAETGKIMF